VEFCVFRFVDKKIPEATGHILQLIRLTKFASYYYKLSCNGISKSSGTIK